MSGKKILPFVQKKIIVDIDEYKDLIFTRKLMKKY